MLLGLSIKLIIREIRSGYLTSMLVSLTLAITIVSGISLFTDRLEQALSTQTEEFLGGNLKFESNKNKLWALFAKETASGVWDQAEKEMTESWFNGLLFCL